MILETSGTPLPLFSTVPPWHQFQLPNQTSRPREVNVIGPRSIDNLNKLTLQAQVGVLHQTILNGFRITKCVIDIVLPTSRSPTTAQTHEGTSNSVLRILESPSNPNFKMCLYIHFSPSEKFCEENPSFNGQAKKVMEKLTRDLTFNSSLQCYYNGDIYGVFVENATECPSFMIVASIELDTSAKSASLPCTNSSRTKEYLSLWSRNLTSKPYFIVEEPTVNHTHCNSYLEGRPANNKKWKQCHRVFYCYRKSSKKDRTVCLNENGHFQKVEVTINHGTDINLLRNPRMLCEGSVEGFSKQKMP